MLPLIFTFVSGRSVIHNLFCVTGSLTATEHPCHDWSKSATLIEVRLLEMGQIMGLCDDYVAWATVTFSHCPLNVGFCNTSRV